MLLNGESLQKLAKDSSYPPRLDGLLYFRKNGPSSEKLQKRYLTLKGNLLYYYNKKSDKIPLGIVVLEGYIVELSNEFEGYCFQLLRRNHNESKNSASYTLMADDAETLETWMTALTTCSYEYLKITVESLKEQAANLIPDEFNEQNNAQPQTIVVEVKRKSKTFAELHEQYAKQIEELPKHSSQNATENETP